MYSIAHIEFFLALAGGLALGCTQESKPLVGAGPTVVAVTATPAPSRAPRAYSAAEAARSGLEFYLAKVPAGMEAAYGFDDRAELARCTLGSPYSVLTVDPAQARGAGPLRLLDTGQLRYPILCSGHARALLTVAHTADGFAAVEFGAAVLARELESLEASTHTAVAGTRAIVRLYQLAADLVLLGPAGLKPEESPLYPLRSARSLFGLSERTVALGEITPLLRERFRAAQATGAGGVR